MRAPHPRQAPARGHGLSGRRRLQGSGDDTGGGAPAAATTAVSGTTAAASQACADAAALKASVAELDQLDPPSAGKAGISGDSLVSDLPTIVSDMQRIDTAWTALQQQIDQHCG